MKTQTPHNNKKTFLTSVNSNFFSLLSVISLLALSGCSDAPVNSSSIVDLIPSFGGTISSKILIESTQEKNNIYYYSFAPLLYDFKENSLGLDDGSEFTVTNDLVGAVNFTVSTNTNNQVIFSGSNQNDSLRVLINYNPSTRTFSYTEYLFLDDASNVLGNPEATKIFFWMNMTDVTIKSDGTFVGPMKVLGVYATADQFLGIQGTDGIEIYHGYIAASDIGTGVAVVTAFNMGSTTLPSGSEVSVSDPSDLSDLSKMQSYVADIGFNGFKAVCNGVTFNDYYYRLGNSEAQVVSGDNTLSLEDFIALLPSGWKANTQLQ